ncbi:hypothetical protein PMIN06_008788 [Paraphaeosphaeria minitans]
MESLVSWLPQRVTSSPFDIANLRQRAPHVGSLRRGNLPRYTLFASLISSAALHTAFQLSPAPLTTLFTMGIWGWWWWSFGYIYFVVHFGALYWPLHVVAACLVLCVLVEIFAILLEFTGISYLAAVF